ncbi:MAG: hypothetical protein HWE20_11610 [Gammaproteobacteria bacterium]|nr:hypothetical protein [Gammaproteobacteria bacterium]
MVNPIKWLTLCCVSVVMAADEPSSETLPDEEMLMFLAETDIQIIVNAELADLLALVELYQSTPMEQTDE